LSQEVSRLPSTLGRTNVALPPEPLRRKNRNRRLDQRRVTPPIYLRAKR
jgi:hypothetical protein